MKTLVNHSGTDMRIVEAAASVLRDGKMIIFPTDTLFASGATHSIPRPSKHYAGSRT